MNKENIILMDEMEELSNRFCVVKSENESDHWLIVDKLNNIIYTFREKDYFNTVTTKYLNEDQERLDFADKQHLRYEMEYWFLFKHGELVYPDEEFTFQPFSNQKEGYYKISHNIPPLFDVIVKDEGSTPELAEYLTKLAEICKEKDLMII